VFAFFWFVYFTRFSRLRAELAAVGSPIREEPTVRTKKERA